MIAERRGRLDWEGCRNVRDLGGLLTVDGRRTRWGAVVRADEVERLSAAGWSALRAHGIRTIVDLRNDDERRADAEPRPPGLTTLHLPLDGIEDREFWERWGSGPQFGTPLYFGPHLDRFPERSARVMAAIANARPGGVVVHCVGGRDRTGMITLLLLALVGVGAEDIALDYAVGVDDQGPEIEEFLDAEGTSAGEAIVSLLTTLDVEARLRAGGLGEYDRGALRARLLGS